MFILLSIAAIKIWIDFGELSCLVFFNFGLVCLVLFRKPSSRTIITSSAPFRHEKEIQSQILANCREKILTESALVESLLSLCENNKINIIHACTVAHKLSTLKLPLTEERMKSFVTKCDELIRNESVQLKSATSLAGCLGKLGFDLDTAYLRFISRNLPHFLSCPDDSLICQVVHVNPCRIYTDPQTIRTGLVYYKSKIFIVPRNIRFVGVCESI
jgi:hypothetical protein